LGKKKLLKGSHFFLNEHLSANNKRREGKKWIKLEKHEMKGKGHGCTMESRYYNVWAYRKIRVVS